MKKKVKRTIYVREVTRIQLAVEWGIDPRCIREKVVFVRCNRLGEVKWNTTVMYYEKELESRNVVKVVPA